MVAHGNQVTSNGGRQGLIWVKRFRQYRATTSLDTSDELLDGPAHLFNHTIENGRVGGCSGNGYYLRVRRASSVKNSVHIIIYLYLSNWWNLLGRQQWSNAHV